MHEWSASLNEQELTPVLPSNRETGRLSDTWIRMDALCFLQCSVREQGETGERAEKGVGGRKDTCMQGGIVGNIQEMVPVVRMEEAHRRKSVCCLYGTIKPVRVNKDVNPDTSRELTTLK